MGGYMNRNKESIKEIILFVPLRNFGWLYNDYLLNENTKIRFLDTETEDPVLQEKGLDSLKYRTVLIYRHFYKNDDDAGIFGYIREIDKILTFLRLFLDRKIWYERYFRLQDIKMGGEIFTNLKPVGLKGVPDLRKVWGKYGKVYEKYRLTFDWYNRSLESSLPPRESILYLVIALEGVLLKDLFQELSYRFSLRGAYAVGNDEKERRKIFDLLKLAYQYRNAVVHNSEKSFLEVIKKIDSTSDFHENLTTYTENLLKRLILDENILDNIESKILNRM